MDIKRKINRSFIIIIIILAISLAGCIGNQLVWYDKETGKPRLKISNLKGMVNTQTKSLIMSVRDGNDFAANFVIIDSNVADSPESATALGDAITSVMTGGASKAAENLTD